MPYAVRTVYIGVVEKVFISELLISLLLVSRISTLNASSRFIRIGIDALSVSEHRHFFFKMKGYADQI